MAHDFTHASITEGVRFTAQVGLPNVVQGLFRRRDAVVSVAGLLRADRLAYGCTAALVRKHGPDPFWVRVAADEVLLVHQPDDIRFVLEGSPTPFASDPDTKRKGMRAFQPTALTLSRGDLWAERRTFAEAILDTGRPLHRLAEGFAALAVEEADTLLALERPATWSDVHTAFLRLTRRVVLGEAAAHDSALSEQLGELMAEGNKLPGKPAAGYDDFHALLSQYVDAPGLTALTGLVAAAPHADLEETDAAGQLIHWLFAMGDTLPANLMRTLAVLASHPLALAEVRTELDGKTLTDASTVAGATYLAGCLQEAMRLWPTTPLLGRVTTDDVRFPGGQVVPAGSQVLIHNLFNHRDRDRIAFADRFAPEEWISGTAAQDWSFNFFSHGPQGCPGAGLSIFLGQAFLGRLLTAAEPTITAGTRLDPSRPLPHALDLRPLQVTLAPR